MLYLSNMKHVNILLLKNSIDISLQTNVVDGKLVLNKFFCLSIFLTLCNSILLLFSSSFAFSFPRYDADIKRPRKQLATHVRKQPTLQSDPFESVAKQPTLQSSPFGGVMKQPMYPKSSLWRSRATDAARCAHFFK